MGILKSELWKLLTRRTVLILLLLIAVNPLLQLYAIKTPGGDGYSQVDYSRAYREAGSRAPDAAPEEAGEGTGHGGEEVDGEALGGETIDYAAVYSEMRLRSRVGQEIEAIAAYDDYLASVDRKADEIAILQRFVDDGGYAAENAERTRGVYRKLQGITPEAQDPMPLLNVTDNDVTNYLAVIMVFIISLGLVFYEKNEGQLGLLRTTLNGRRKLMAAKVAAMFLSALFVVVSLYAVNAVVGRCVFGTIDYGRPLQSIYVYMKSPFRMSIGGFLGTWFAAKLLTLFLLGTFFMLMGAVFNNIIFVFVSSAAAVLAEVLLHAGISGTHFLAFFKYVNIAHGIKTGGLFADYVNLNLFGTPVNTFFLYWGVWAIAAAAVTFSVVNRLGATHETRAASAKKTKAGGGRECHTNLFLHESYKLLFPGKCLIVLVLACAITAWWNPAAKVQFDRIDEVYYKDYMDRFYGALDDANRERIGAEQAKFDRLAEDIAADYEKGRSALYIDVKYRDELSRQDAFEMVRNHVEYLDAVDGGWLFFDKGYGILTDGAQPQNRDVMQAFVYVILLIAMTFGIFGPDHRNSEVRILRSTYRGRGKLGRLKCVLGVACTLAAFALVYLVHVFNILGAYGTGGIHAPAASIENLAHIPENISVLQYLLIILLMRIVAGFAIVAAVFLLFRLLKNNITVIIACIVLFMIPLVLVGLSLPGTQYILLNPLLLGNVI